MSRDRDRLELELQSLLGQALVGVEGWSAPGAEEAFVRARTLGEELQDNEPLAPVLLALGTIYEVRGEFGRAEEAAQAFLRQVPDAAPRRRLEVAELLACSLFHQGSFAHALEQAQRGVALFAGEEGHYDTFPATLGDNAGISCHAWSALALLVPGLPGSGPRARPRSAWSSQATRGASYSLAPAAGAARDPPPVPPRARSHAPSGPRRPSPLPPTAATRTASRWGGSCGAGHSLRAAEFDEGIRELERGLLASRATGAHMDDAYYLGLLADARLRAGRVEAGLAAVEEALELAHRERSFFCEAELVRLRGELLLATGGEAGETEACFRQALELARGQSARSLELRIANCLTILRGDAEARSLLARVHGAFTEGFETPDLSRSADLLAEAANRAAAAEDVPPASPVLSPAKAATAGDLLERDPALGNACRSARGVGARRRTCGLRDGRAGDRQDLTRDRASSGNSKPRRGCCSALATTSRSRGRWAHSRPRLDRLRAARSGALDRRRVARDPEPPDRGAGTAPRPTVLVLEDVHWADDATRDAITVIGRRISSLPALLVLTFRGGEAPPGHPLSRPWARSARATRSFSSWRRCRRVRSPRWPATMRDDVYTATGGNPFYVTELLAFRAADDLPPSIANAVLARASRLDDDVGGLVQLVSVVPTCRHSLLDAVMPGWAGAQRRSRNVASYSTSPPAYVRFRHELARNAIRSSIPIAARRRLHSEILEALLAAEADPAASCTTPRPRAQTMSSPSTPSSPRGGRGAGVQPGGVLPLPAGLGFLGRLPASEQAAVFEELADAAYPVGRLEDAFLAIERAIVVHGDLGDEAAGGRCTRGLRGSTGSRATATPRTRRARGDRDSRAARRVAELARAYSGLSQLAMLAEDAEQAFELGEKALELATRLGDESTRAHALINIGSAKIELDHRETERCSRPTPSPMRPATGMRLPGRSATSGTA